MYTFEFVLHFVRCDTVTVSPNQIIIIIIIIIMYTCTVHKRFSDSSISSLQLFVFILKMLVFFHIKLVLEVQGKQLTFTDTL